MVNNIVIIYISFQHMSLFNGWHPWFCYTCTGIWISVWTLSIPTDFLGLSQVFQASSSIIPQLRAPAFPCPLFSYICVIRRHRQLELLWASLTESRMNTFRWVPWVCYCANTKNSIANTARKISWQKERKLKQEWCKKEKKQNNKAVQRIRKYKQINLIYFASFQQFSRSGKRGYLKPVAVCLIFGKY
jgi:hypothetical protein